MTVSIKLPSGTAGFPFFTLFDKEVAGAGGGKGQNMGGLCAWTFSRGHGAFCTPTARGLLQTGRGCFALVDGRPSGV